MPRMPQSKYQTALPLRAVTGRRSFRSFFDRSQAKPPRRSHLTVVVLPDPPTAFHAYRLLQYHGISPEHLAIVGEGYCRPESVGLYSPAQIALRRAGGAGLRAGLLGAMLGAAIAMMFRWLMETPWGDRVWLLVPVMAIVSGFCGATLGALFGFLGEGSTASLYRHYLQQGNCLLAIEGSAQLVRQSQELLGQYSVLEIQC